MSLYYITNYILVLKDTSIVHLDQITLGFVDVPASEKNNKHSKGCIFCVCCNLYRLLSTIFCLLRLPVNMCSLRFTPSLNTSLSLHVDDIIF